MSSRARMCAGLAACALVLPPCARAQERGGVLSVASIVGFITLFGIATRNGIMLVSHIRYVQEHEGVTDFRAAVLRGATNAWCPS